MTETRRLASDLAVIRQGRILFMHHSVGADVLAGLQSLDAETGGGRLRVSTLEAEPGIQGPVLAHGPGGKNGDPVGKIDDFAAALRRSPRVRPQLAFMKLCFVDFNPRTDVGALFAHYASTLEALKRERPEIRFAHVTAPLYQRPTGAKAAIYRLLGREVWEDASNAKRAEFNALLTKTFASDPVFDLARAEATGPDGATSTFELGGRSYLSLHPANTHDGGHLNEPAQRAVAAAAAAFLAGALGGAAGR